MLHSSRLHKALLGIFIFFTTASVLTAEPQMTFQGQDKGRPCFLYVHSVNPIVVSTSYEHDGQGLGKVELESVPEGDGKMLKWTNPTTQEFLLVQLKQVQPTLEDPNAFRVKWLHSDHLHDNICSDLKQVN